VAHNPHHGCPTTLRPTADRGCSWSAQSGHGEVSVLQRGQPSRERQAPPRGVTRGSSDLPQSPQTRSGTPLTLRSNVSNACKSSPASCASCTSIGLRSTSYTSCRPHWPRQLRHTNRPPLSSAPGPHHPETPTPTNHWSQRL